MNKSTASHKLIPYQPSQTRTGSLPCNPIRVRGPCGGGSPWGRRLHSEISESFGRRDDDDDDDDDILSERKIVRLMRRVNERGREERSELLSSLHLDFKGDIAAALIPSAPPV